MEWNMVSSNEKKTNKYEDELRPQMKSNKPLKIQAFEVSARGLVGDSLQLYLNILANPIFKLWESMRIKIFKNASIIAIQCSQMIYKNRNNKNWVPPSVKDMKFKMLSENMELQE